MNPWVIVGSVVGILLVIGVLFYIFAGDIGQWLPTHMLRQAVGYLEQRTWHPIQIPNGKCWNSGALYLVLEAPETNKVKVSLLHLAKYTIPRGDGSEYILSNEDRLIVSITYQNGYPELVSIMESHPGTTEINSEQRQLCCQCWDMVHKLQLEHSLC